MALADKHVMRRPEHKLSDDLPAVWPGWLIALVVSFSLYAATASRGAQWQDSGQHILRILTGELVNPGGLALSHPVHFWFGSAACVLTPSEPALGITLVSALGAALAVANVFGCVVTLTRSRTAAALAACSLAIAHTFWQLATITESYSLTVALLSGELWAIAAYGRRHAPRCMYLAALCNGLTVSNHLQGAITSPLLLGLGLIAWTRGSAKGRHVLVAVLLAFTASLPYTALVALEAFRTGDVGGAIHSALFGERFAGAVLNVGLSTRTIAICLAFTLLSFPNLTLPLAMIGLRRGRDVMESVATRRYLATALLLHALFVIRYNVIDAHTFLLPTFVLVCVYAGVGAGWIIRRARSARGCQCEPIGSESGLGAGEGEPDPRASARAKSHAAATTAAVPRLVIKLAVSMLIITPLVYAIAPEAAHRANVLRGVERDKPYRDDYRYLFWPWSVADRSAERMASHAVRLASPDGTIIVEDPMAEFAVRYVALRENLPRILVIRPKGSESAILESIRAHRPVVLVPATRGKAVTPATKGDWNREGDLLKLQVERE